MIVLYCIVLYCIVLYCIVLSNYMSALAIFYVYLPNIFIIVYGMMTAYPSGYEIINNAPNTHSKARSEPQPEAHADAVLHTSTTKETSPESQQSSLSKKPFSLCDWVTDILNHDNLLHTVTDIRPTLLVPTYFDTDGMLRQKARVMTPATPYQAGLPALESHLWAAGFSFCRAKVCIGIVKFPHIHWRLV